MAGPSQFRRLDGFAAVAAARILPHYLAALAGEAGWGEVRDAFARTLVLAALLGHRRTHRLLRRKRLVPPAENAPVRLSPDPLASLNSAESEVASLPFIEAVNFFRRDVPELQRVVDGLRRRSRLAADLWTERQRLQASATVERIMRRRGSTAPERPLFDDPEARIGNLGGIGLRPDAVEEAIRTAIGRAEVARVLDTEVRTATLAAFNGGSREQAAENRAAVPVCVIDEIHDRRNRDYLTKGPHWIMDGFAAPTDDAIWQRITPPNGWNCRAVLRFVTADEAVRRGWAVRGGDGESVIVDAAAMRRQFARQWALIEAGEYPDPGFKL